MSPGTFLYKITWFNLLTLHKLKGWKYFVSFFLVLKLLYNQICLSVRNEHPVYIICRSVHRSFYFILIFCPLFVYPSFSFFISYLWQLNNCSLIHFLQQSLVFCALLWWIILMAAVASVDAVFISYQLQFVYSYECLLNMAL